MGHLQIATSISQLACRVHKAIASSMRSGQICTCRPHAITVLDVHVALLSTSLVVFAKHFTHLAEALGRLKATPTETVALARCINVS